MTNEDDIARLDRERIRWFVGLASIYMLIVVVTEVTGLSGKNDVLSLLVLLITALFASILFAEGSAD